MACCRCLHEPAPLGRCPSLRFPRACVVSVTAAAAVVSAAAGVAGFFHSCILPLARVGRRPAGLGPTGGGLAAKAPGKVAESVEAVFLPRSNRSAQLCRLLRLPRSSQPPVLGPDAVIEAHADGPSTRVTARVSAGVDGTHTACFCPVEGGRHSLHWRLDYVSRRQALQDPPPRNATSRVTNASAGSKTGGPPAFLGMAMAGSPMEVAPEQIPNVSLREHKLCNGVGREGGWWWPRDGRTPPLGLAPTRRFSSTELRRCLTERLELFMLGDSVSERLCCYLVRTMSPACLMAVSNASSHCAFAAPTKKCNTACTRLRANGLFNGGAAVYEQALLRVAAEGPKFGRLRRRVLVLNVGLWDAAFGSLSAYLPGGLFARVLAAAQAAQRNGTEVVWRSTTAVHPKEAAQHGALQPKLAFFTQPRVEALNQMSLALVRQAGLPVLDAFAMTRLRPDLLEPGDMRHYDDRMNAELAQWLAREFCRD